MNKSKHILLFSSSPAQESGTKVVPPAPKLDVSIESEPHFQVSEPTKSPQVLDDTLTRESSSSPGESSTVDDETEYKPSEDSILAKQEEDQEKEVLTFNANNDEHNEEYVNTSKFVVFKENLMSLFKLIRCQGCSNGEEIQEVIEKTDTTSISVKVICKQGHVFFLGFFLGKTRPKGPDGFDQSRLNKSLRN